MRILHTADWHLGKWLGPHQRLAEQHEVLNEICEIADQEAADVVLIAGDVFDTFNPPAEATALFYRTVKRLSKDGKRPVIAIAGNHDSPDRLENPDPLARECGIILIGYPNAEVEPFELAGGFRISRTAPGFLELELPDGDCPLRLLVTPYANEQRLKQFLGVDGAEDELRKVLRDHWCGLADEYCDDKGVNLLMTHLFFINEGEKLPDDEGDDERPVLHVGGAQAIFCQHLPQQLQYVALGHIHGHRQVSAKPCPVVYSSSPLCYSFGDKSKEKCVCMVDVEPGQPASYQKVPLTRGKRLHRHTCGSVEQAVEWLREHQECWVDLTIRSGSYLSGSDQKVLRQAHSGIVNIIPQMEADGQEDGATTPEIDLGKPMEELFADYFEKREGVPPGEQIMALFKEVLATEQDEE